MVLLYEWILPSGGVALGRVFACSLGSRLVTSAAVLSQVGKENSYSPYKAKATPVTKYIL